MTSQSKVYISNLNYHTTEDELREYLAETKAANVFIPNYFVGFGSSRFKPLGIAYADLPTAEDADGFIKEFEGKSFKDRKLKVKLHVPYAPTQKLSRLSSVNSIKRLARNDNDESKEENKENVDIEGSHSPVDKKYSENGIFVKGLKAKTSEDDLKAIFKDFNPTEIKIFKPRGWMRGLKHRSHNAIVTLDLPEKKTLDEVISSCSGGKCCGNTIVVMRAYVNGDREINAKPDKVDPQDLDDSQNQVQGSPDASPQDVAPAEVAFVAVGEVPIDPGDSGLSKEESTEQTIQSSDQDNASEKAILGDNSGSGDKSEEKLEEKPEIKASDKASDKANEKASDKSSDKANDKAK